MISKDGMEYSEHQTRKVIPGDIETVRRRLSDVLEEFHYFVVSENPLQAKRPAGKNTITANVLEYDTRLTIALKALSPVSTLATFDYAIEFLFTKSERATLEREADAIIALAAAPLHKIICPACKIETSGRVRFCRECGTPMAQNRLPVEVELVQLMAGTSASQIEINTGLMFILFTAMIALPMILLGKPKAVGVGWILLLIGEILGVLILSFGLHRLNKTLNQASASQTDAPPVLQRTPPEPVALPQEQDYLALPAQPMSVTENTTALIREAENLPVTFQQAKTTDSME